MDNKGDDQAAVLTNPRRARFESLGGGLCGLTLQEAAVYT